MKLTGKTFPAMKSLMGVAVILCALLVYELATDPYVSERNRVLAFVESKGIDGGEQGGEPAHELDYEKILWEIGTDQKRWGPLVERKRPSPRPKAKPNLNQMIVGLKVLTVISGPNNEVQAIISDSRKRSQEIYKKGDKVRELTVDGFTSDGIVLSYESETIKVPF